MSRQNEVQEILEFRKNEDGILSASRQEIEETTREKLNYSILKDETIKCANCNKDLISIIKVKENQNQQSAIKALCPYCNDSSFWYRISGQIYLQAVDGLSIVDMPVKVQNGVIFTTIEVICDDET